MIVKTNDDIAGFYFPVIRRRIGFDLEYIYACVFFKFLYGNHTFSKVHQLTGNAQPGSFHFSMNDQLTRGMRRQVGRNSKANSMGAWYHGGVDAYYLPE